VGARYADRGGRLDRTKVEEMIMPDTGSIAWGAAFVPLRWRLGLLVNLDGQWLFAFGPLRFVKMRDIT
jgi:hypothetical protein